VIRAGLILAALLLAGCSSAEERAAAEASESAASAKRVAELTADLAPKIRYEVTTGTASSASVTMETPDGSRTQDVDVPMTSKAGNAYLEFTFVAGDFVYVSAQNGGESGTVSCRITNGDGEVIASNEASGGFAIATCTGEAR
jgi:hypothetical protein